MAQAQTQETQAETQFRITRQVIKYSMMLERMMQMYYSEYRVSHGDIVVMIYEDGNTVKMDIMDLFDREFTHITLSYDKFDYDTLKQKIIEVLKNELPFCSDGHDPMIHGGDALLYTYDKLICKVNTPEDIDECAEKLMVELFFS